MLDEGWIAEKFFYGNNNTKNIYHAKRKLLSAWTAALFILS